MPTVFYLGATGYAGSTALVTLRAAFPTYTFKALVRNEDAVETLNTKPPTEVHAAPGISFTDLPKVKAVKGTFADLDLITKLSSEADVVINTADSDSLELINALLRGLQQRHDKGRVATLIHTSGAGVFLDNAQGSYNPGGRVWSDNEADVKELSETLAVRPHGPGDLVVLKAHEEGYVNAVIVVPSVIHGIGRSPLQRASQFYQFAVPDVLQRRDAGGYPRKGAMYIGEGTTRLDGVHVNDLADLYILVLRALTAPDTVSSIFTSSPYSRYVIATAERSVPFKDIASALGHALKEFGELDDPTPVSYRLDEYQGHPVVAALAARNSLVKPYRASQLGWKPTREGILETIKDDVQVALDAMKTK